jgi:S1-C subfamily serine protease
MERLAIATLARALFLAATAGWLVPGANAALPDTIDKVKASVVAVGTFQKTRSPPFLFRGTGFVVGDGTQIVTNAHVLPGVLDVDGQEKLMVLVPAAGVREGLARDASTLVTDKARDLALLRVAGAALPALRVAEADDVREGADYAFTGYPMGNALGLSPVTHRAMVSAVTPIALPAGSAGQLDPKAIRAIKSGAFPIYQLDATAYPGNSGSPLYDPRSGEVVGVVNMGLIKGTKESALSSPTGISFAIPVRFVRELLKGN